MLKMGLPMGAVKSAIQRDGEDPSVMDLFPETSINSQRGGTAKKPKGRRKKIYWNANDESQVTQRAEPVGAGGIAAMATAAALKKKPKTETVEPVGTGGIATMAAAVSMKQKQKMEVVEPINAGGIRTIAAALKEDEDYAKYFKMLKVGLPMDAVKHSMKRDDKDPTILDLDHSKSLGNQVKSVNERLDTILYEMTEASRSLNLCDEEDSIPYPRPQMQWVNTPKQESDLDPLRDEGRPQCEIDNENDCCIHSICLANDYVAEWEFVSENNSESWDILSCEDENSVDSFHFVQSDHTSSAVF